MMNGLYLYFYWFILFMCLFIFFKNKFHLLCLLLSLEFFMLMTYFMLCLILMSSTNEFYMSFYYLTITVCEGGLGLGLLVNLIHSHGNELVNSFIMNI